MQNDTLYEAGGLELNFFLSGKKTSSDKNIEIARNALRVLMMGYNDKVHWHGLKSLKVLSAVLCERSPELLLAMRLAFQEGFTDIFSQLDGKTLTPSQHKQVLFYLSNCLGLLPFSDIKPNQLFTIPQWIDNKWVQVTYKVSAIELTPTSGVEALFIHDQDRVFAYGLEPVTHIEKATPQLIFMGTTYPAGQGFVTQVCTDLEWFATPGSHLYCTGRENIKNWLTSTATQYSQKPHVCGMSLGGSLSLILALDQGDKLASVHAINPPGLCELGFKKSKKRTAASKLPVTILSGGNDVVSYFGRWDPNWLFLRLTPPKNKKGPSGFHDHALNYAGYAGTTFTNVNINVENTAREWRNFWIYNITRALVYGLFILPCRYIMLSACRYLFNHKIEMTLISSLTATLVLMPSLTLNFYVCVALALLALIYLVVKIPEPIKIVCGLNDVKPPKCHEHNEEIDKDVPSTVSI